MHYYNIDYLFKLTFKYIRIIYVFFRIFYLLIYILIELKKNKYIS